MGENHPPSALPGMAYLKSKSSYMNHTTEEAFLSIQTLSPALQGTERNERLGTWASHTQDPWPLLTLFLSSYQASSWWVTPGFLSQSVCRHKSLEKTGTKEGEDRKRGVGEKQVIEGVGETDPEGSLGQGPGGLGQILRRAWTGERGSSETPSKGSSALWGSPQTATSRQYWCVTGMPRVV